MPNHRQIRICLVRHFVSVLQNGEEHGTWVPRCRKYHNNSEHVFQWFAGYKDLENSIGQGSVYHSADH
jgi:hypothetical protein